MIFVVEDEPVLRRSIVEYLTVSGADVEGFADAESALASARESPPDVVVSDLQLPKMGGLELMTAIGAIDPSTVRIAMTAHGSVETAVRAMRGGCYEFLEKPVDLERLQRLVARAVGERRSGRELDWLRDQSDGQILGESEAIADVRAQIDQLAELGAQAPPIFIAGETGVGKGLVARHLHVRRFGKDAPMIEVNCSALPASLIEAELFGYERSAFTDAKEAKPGLFEAASGGTLFLDEIGELALEVQAKLLTVVESGRLRRLGSVRERKVDAAIVAASNVDLEAAVRQRRFRADLYHRIAALTLEIPPLRERGDDAILLARHFLHKARAQYRSKRVERLSADAEAHIRAAEWTGNIRELRFAVERAVILAPKDEIELAASRFGAAHTKTTGPAIVANGTIRVELPDEGVPFVDLERAIVTAALERTDGNVVRAAELLDLKRDAMRYRIDKLGLGEMTQRAKSRG